MLYSEMIDLAKDESKKRLFEMLGRTYYHQVIERLYYNKPYEKKTFMEKIQKDDFIDAFLKHKYVLQSIKDTEIGDYTDPMPFFYRELDLLFNKELT